MRTKLKQINGVRKDFIAEVSKFGFKSAYIGPSKKTVCLISVTDCETGSIVTDHLWLTVGKQLETLELQIGDRIKFTARVGKYEKGYKGYRDDVFEAPVTTDYRLERPTKIVKIV